MSQKKMTSVVSFSCTLEMLNKLANWSTERDTSLSAAIRHHLRMGFLYVEKVMPTMLPSELTVSGVKNGEKL